VQEETLRAWATAQGHSLVLVIHERAAGDMDALGRRRGLHEALAAVIERRAAGLAVTGLDVLGSTVSVQEAILALLFWHDGEVHTCRTGRVSRGDPVDSARAVLRQALSAFVQLEHDVRAARSRSRRHRKAARGGYTGGAPSFGYRVEAHELVADAIEQAALARIEDLRGTGASLRAIARVLSDEGYRPKRSDRWHPESVRRILARLDRVDQPGAGEGNTQR
jgi:DNA invertase Pin-like site-specific DNA recombinase